mmetsp:Transcript_63986/g.78262  ORF Transcript_63986/g.78262 Transcript_63986/m.78262 type:complete len:273 (-) Transcript_63986:130-948(-)
MPQPSKAQIEAKMAAKFGKRSSRTAGKGSMRRKYKAPSKSSTQDDKRLMTQLKKLSVSQIPAIEEVNLFKDDNTVVHFIKPKVQAEIASNTYVVSGNCEIKKLEELIPQIIPQLGGEHIESLKQTFANSFGALNPSNDDDDDDVVPALVGDETFEDVAARDEKNQNDDATGDDVTNDNNDADAGTTQDNGKTDETTNDDDDNKATDVSNNDNQGKTDETKNDDNVDDVPDLVESKPKTDTGNDAPNNASNVTDTNGDDSAAVKPDESKAVDV